MYNGFYGVVKEFLTQFYFLKIYNKKFATFGFENMQFSIHPDCDIDTFTDMLDACCDSYIH